MTNAFKHLTLRDLIRLYTGPNALPVPPALRGWVECAELHQSLTAERGATETLSRKKTNDD